MARIPCYDISVIMRRALPFLTALASLAHVVNYATTAHPHDEAERLWLVGERAVADGLHTLGRRTLERFVAAHPRDKRVPAAVLLWCAFAPSDD